ncbi:MAG: DUF2892 domain-containing protein [Planctomycetes bacterium]|nr:DUF2892 domain-containing protein [Planctomycetota bacterium]
MSMERWIRLIAGTFILASLLLAYFVSRHFLWFTAFVGVNLLQSSLTRWCLMEDILARFGVKRCGETAPPHSDPAA